MAAGDRFKISAIGRTNDGSAIVFDFGYTDATGGSFHFDTGTMAGDFATFYQTTAVQALPDTYQFVKYRAACVAGPNAGEVGFSNVDPPVFGARTSAAMLPNEIAISLQRNTGHVSRHDRGRVFWGPVSAAFRATTGPNDVEVTEVNLVAARDLLKTVFPTQGRNLTPVILAADGSSTDHAIVNVLIAPVFVHRRSRRPRIGV